MFSFASAIDHLGTFSTNQNFELVQICDDCTEVNISNVQYPNGTLLNLNEVMTKTGYNYNYTFSTDLEGDYKYSVCGDKTGGFKCETFTFNINEGGVEMTGGRSALTLGLLSLLVIFAVLSLFMVFKVEGYLGKFIFYWLSHVLMILVSFASWQVGVEGLLIGTALTGIFRILFWVLIIAVLPMILVSFAWVIYIHTYNEHFQKLTEKGVDTEEAFRMTEKKKGWKNGN